MPPKKIIFLLLFKSSKFYNSADLEILFGFLCLSGERFKFFRKLWKFWVTKDFYVIRDWSYFVLINMENLDGYYRLLTNIVSCTRLNKIYWNLSKKYRKSDWKFKKDDSVWQNTQWNQLSNAHAGCDHQTNSKLGTEHFWWFIWVNSDSNRRHNVDKVFRFFEFVVEIVNRWLQ